MVAEVELECCLLARSSEPEKNDLKECPSILHVEADYNKSRLAAADTTQILLNQLRAIARTLVFARGLDRPMHPPATPRH